MIVFFLFNYQSNHFSIFLWRDPHINWIGENLWKSWQIRNWSKSKNQRRGCMLADKLATNCLDTSGCLMTAHVQTWAQYFCSRAKPVRYEYYLLWNYQHKSLNTMNTFIYIWITKYSNYPRSRNVSWTDTITNFVFNIGLENTGQKMSHTQGYKTPVHLWSLLEDLDFRNGKMDKLIL